MGRSRRKRSEFVGDAQVDCLDKQGNPITKDGKVQKKKIQRPRLLSELPEEVARTIET